MRYAAQQRLSEKVADAFKGGSLLPPGHSVGLASFGSKVG
jgi:hypothetical protein